MMSDPTPPKPEPLLKNPQVVAAIIGGVITLVVAIVGVLPVLLNKSAPTPQPIVLLVTATPVPATDAPTVIPNTPVPVAATAIPVDTSIPPTLLPIATQALQQVEAVTQLPPTFTPAQANTPIPPTSTTAAPSPAPILPTAVPNVLLLYDDVSFTLANQSGGKLSLEGVTFHSDRGDWDARRWGPSVYNSLPAGKCLRLKNAGVGNRQPPAPCTNSIYGLIEVGATAQFWAGVDSFQVLYNGQVIATCMVSSRSCPIAIG